MYKNKMDKDLNIRLYTTKILGENIGRAVFDVNCSSRFWDPCPRLIEVKTKINKWHLIKLKCFFHSK